MNVYTTTHLGMEPLNNHNEKIGHASVEAESVAETGACSSVTGTNASQLLQGNNSGSLSAACKPLEPIMPAPLPDQTISSLHGATIPELGPSSVPLDWQVAIRQAFADGMLPVMNQQQSASLPLSVTAPSPPLQTLYAQVTDPSLLAASPASYPFQHPMLANAGEKRKAVASVDANRKQRKADPSVVSSSSNSLGDVPPPQPKEKAELDRMTPAERRRYERNLREQQRSYRISQQIKQLRDVLSDSGIPFKPNKFSILVSVAEYIKQLQSRAIMLDAEHKKLLNTIYAASELASSGQCPSSCDDKTALSSLSPSPDQDQDMILVQGIDYISVFTTAPVAMGVASLDGRVLACNDQLERLFGVSREDIDQQSLFLYIQNHQDVFEAMADLLKRSSVATETGRSAELLFWCGIVTTSKCPQRLQMNITLTNTVDDNPKYFNFSAAPLAIF